MTAIAFTSGHDLATRLHKKVRWASTGIDSDFFRQIMDSPEPNYGYLIYHTEQTGTEEIKQLVNETDCGLSVIHGQKEYHNCSLIYKEAE